MKAIVMNSAGGYDTLEYVERPDPVAGPGQALVEVAAAGVNFLDTGVRKGPREEATRLQVQQHQIKRIGSWPNESIDVPFSVSAPR
jgi:NADPH:quinone reductase-like Zn-dependent oxidoreductase